HACARRCPSGVFIQPVWRGDAQQINFFMINEVPPVAVSVAIRDAVYGPKLPERIRLQASERNKINIGCVGVTGQMLLSGPTESDHTSTKPPFAAHARTPSPTRRLLKRGAGRLTTAGSTKSAACSGRAHNTALASTRLMSGWW